MHPLLSLSVFGLLLPTALMHVVDSPLDCIPRRSVPSNSNNALLFWEEGVFNYSAMLLREDLDLLVVGAREAVFALDLRNISKKITSVEWKASPKQVGDCRRKGKDAETECKNYIRILHEMMDGKMYVCGTNAFDPACKKMSYVDGNLTLMEPEDDGKGKCPFDPFQRHASIMIKNDLYSATSMNFLGSEPVLMLSPHVNPQSGPIRTEIKSSWLYDPNFVSMASMPDSEKGNNDDKVYLFFSETAVEFDYYSKLGVSRVARVCKGDEGGRRTLQKKWTSFLKASLDCPVPGSQLPYIIQDSYRWCDPSLHWKECVFYATFTSQSHTSEISAVCAYHMSDISKQFSEGKYKTPAPVETSYIKWVTFSGEVPQPRPGACINREATNSEIKTTLDLPDKTLQFIRDKPLMDQAIEPIGGRPLLTHKGAAFTQIIVKQVQALDGEKYKVMFIGTDQGKLLKALHNEEMFIIEEVQLFTPPQKIKNLKFSNKMGQIYVGSDISVVQIPPANCERSSTCFDCVLSRDPYCGWDKVERKCVSISSSQSVLIQDMKGNASHCPDAGPVVEPLTRNIRPGRILKLRCPSPSNLAKLIWKRNGIPLPHSPEDGLLILDNSDDNNNNNNSGSYSCLSVEKSKAGEYETVVVNYEVGISLENTAVTQAQCSGQSHSGLIVAVVVLVVCLVLLLTWRVVKRHINLPCDRTKEKGEEPQQTRDLESSDASEPLAAEKPNNHTNTGDGPCISTVNGIEPPCFPVASLKRVYFEIKFFIF
ncbi:semaphorin-4E-like isoform X1 [Gambusia affinis]|uniref:semaphorin-4E-like isoform X1 n=1 Tax=Gambusia affinis TaxID=33528 RepID=UPI001CDCF61D|nr:semaphorin-4E-like isoform X1 [Gambusia affinis]XP_043991431.1 semaphorin-4E-like isoform X1 [Gambusia affinis]